MAGPSLKVTDQTSVKDLSTFASQVGKDATIHGKSHKDGSVTLYVSKQGKGTGLKNYLFGTTDKRRAAANGVMTKILFANTSSTKLGPELKGKLGDDYTFILGSVPSGAKPMSGQTIKDISSMALDSFNEASLPGNLPSGMKMDDKGNLTGGSSITTIPSDCSGQFMGHRGLDIATVLQEVKTPSISPGAKLQDVSGQKIASQAVNDFWRLDFDIPLPNGTHFKSSNDVSDDQHARNEHVTTALRQFAGSDQATTVLSSVLTQTTLTPLPGCISKSDGAEAKLQFHSAFSRVGRDFTMRGPDGKLTPVEPQFVGGAKWSLSKVGNDFKISVTWQAHCEAKEGFESELPLHKDGLIAVNFKVDFLVDGAEAAKGNLKLSMPGGLQTQYSGRLTV